MLLLRRSAQPAFRAGWDFSECDPDTALTPASRRARQVVEQRAVELARWMNTTLRMEQRHADEQLRSLITSWFAQAQAREAEELRTTRYRMTK
eukprot:SAG11_NODE_1714_length_4398_cov_2.677832_5_plen_93_part_00